jgi:hypothetical protein
MKIVIIVTAALVATLSVAAAYPVGKYPQPVVTKG